MISFMGPCLSEARAGCNMATGTRAMVMPIARADSGDEGQILFGRTEDPSSSFL